MGGGCWGAGGVAAERSSWWGLADLAGSDGCGLPWACHLMPLAPIPVPAISCAGTDGGIDVNRLMELADEAEEEEGETLIVAS